MPPFPKSPKSYLSHCLADILSSEGVFQTGTNISMTLPLSSVGRWPTAAEGITQMSS